MAECQRPAQVPWNQNGLLSPSSYIAYSYFPFITLGNLSSVPAQDFQFLELQGCLYVPSRPILDKFTRQYFLHMHPLLPALNEGDFWDMYFQHSNPRAPGRKISLLVFQAMLFLCCNVSSKNFVDVAYLFADLFKVCSRNNAQHSWATYNTEGMRYLLSSCNATLGPRYRVLAHSQVTGCTFSCLVVAALLQHSTQAKCSMAVHRNSVHQGC